MHLFTYFCEGIPYLQAFCPLFLLLYYIIENFVYRTEATLVYSQSAREYIYIYTMYNPQSFNNYTSILQFNKNNAIFGRFFFSTVNLYIFVPQHQTHGYFIKDICHHFVQFINSRTLSDPVCFIFC